MPKLVTANVLTTGHVVFLGAGDQWVSSVDDAVVYADAAAAEAGLEVGLRDAARAIVVEPFVTETGGPNAGRPDATTMSLRDTIRAHGPTIRFLPAAAQG